MKRIKGNALTTVAVGLGIAGTILGTLCAALALAWSASGERTAIVQDIEHQAASLVDHEQRLRLLERQGAEIASDVKWIRATMEDQAR